MRVGIITLHKTNNFGACLQAYALYTFAIKDMTVKLLTYCVQFIVAIDIAINMLIRESVNLLLQD